MRANKIDVPALLKQGAALQSLAQLKYVNDDFAYRLVKTFFNVLKAGLGYSSTIAKYEATGDAATVRISKDPENKFLSRVGSCIETYMDTCKALAQLCASAEVSGLTHSLFGLKPESIFGEASTKWDVFFDSVGLRATNLKAQVDRCVTSLFQVAQGVQAGTEKHWRSELPSDAGMADLKATSKTSLKKLDGNALKSSLTTAWKVGYIAATSPLKIENRMITRYNKFFLKYLYIYVDIINIYRS